ncbi:hypothetical protein GCM10007939_03980 [Amylibacter marinus]|uniref:FAD assembly factor SdhE n=1 Tax=Amylibacter marinus TaxID=1475483 RepID=A0ABQ5VRR7_9RHOB|nr:succinate dehydrogenase assembly factor 2 [Amylibacter marinus]GLQ34115.1 hypothetical protein GCM10007939_03980 [Amylibacter marinus]
MTDPTETHETRLKRLRLRSWRRGIKEMDLILGGFADHKMASLSVAELDEHEIMMSEHDHDLYMWISEQQPAPIELASALDRVRRYFLETK